MNEITERVLTERISEQEKTIARLQEEIRTAEQRAADRVIRRLRLHGTILLHVSGDMEKYEGAVRSEGLGRVGEDLICQTWNLESAPVSDEVKGVVRKACKNGMSKW